MFPYFLLLTLSAALVAHRVAIPRGADIQGWLIAFNLLVFAALRGQGVDYEEYRRMYELVRVEFEIYGYLSANHLLEISRDVLFGYLLAGIAAFEFNVQALFVVSASLSIGLKALAFSLFYGDIAIPMAVLLCTYYFLHDFTQIRIAIALGFCFVAFYFLVTRRFNWWLISGLAGALFQMSSLAFLAISLPLFLDGRKRVLGIGAALLLPMVSATLFPRIFDIEEISSFVSRIDMTLETPSVLPLVFFAGKLVFLGYLYVQLRLSSGGSRIRRLALDAGAPVLMYCVVGVLFFVSWRDVYSIVAYRMYEFFDAFSVFLLAGSAMTVRNVQVPLVVILYCCLSFYYNYNAGLLVPYELGSYLQ